MNGMYTINNVYMYIEPTEQKGKGSTEAPCVEPSTRIVLGLAVTRKYSFLVHLVTRSIWYVSSYGVALSMSFSPNFLMYQGSIYLV